MKFANHNLTHDIKLTANMGELVPVACFEALPGDVVNHEIACLIRTQPLVTPVMHKAEVKLHTWFVPYRLLHSGWEDFITGGQDGLDATVLPTIALPSIAVGSLADYLGIPVSASAKTVSAFPFRAYTHIWNNYYRDQDLQTELPINLGSGADATTSVLLQNACWEKDYFTSARPTAQKGSAVTVPLTGSAPVVTNNQNVLITDQNSAPEQTWNHTSAVGNPLVMGGGTIGSNAAIRFGSQSGLTANLSAVTGININDLRLVVALQRFKENMSRYGSRYMERLEQAFGVTNLDARLQLPEYLGGGSQTLQFSEVLQTAEGVNPTGTLRGHGIGAMRSNRYKTKIPEYGVIITLMVARPKTQYVDGLNRMWSRLTKEDYYQPELENLGAQAVRNKEVYHAHTTPDGTFGFQDRYDEYRRIESRIAGDFRTTLDSWHMARKFTSDPALNATFVSANPTNRIYAVTSADQLLVYCNHNLYVRRRLSKISKPMLF
ncbi:MAG: major capsid protein [Microviridae sp.]|nr:MAG: major capsid protein [Microviridae sp.]